MIAALAILERDDKILYRDRVRVLATKTAPRRRKVKAVPFCAATLDTAEL